MFRAAFPSTGFGGWRVLLGSLLLLTGIPGLAHAQTPAGTRVLNRAVVHFTDVNGHTGIASDEALVTVGRFADVRLEPPRLLHARGTEAINFTHTLTNRGNAPDTLFLSATGPHGWTIRAYVDGNADGVRDARDPLLTSGIVLGTGESREIFVEALPQRPPVRSREYLIEVESWSGWDPAARVRVVDRVVGSSGSGRVEKRVSTDAATPGDTLTYTFLVRAPAESPMQEIVLQDPLPEPTEYVGGSFRTGNEPRPASYAADTRTLTANLGGLSAGDSLLVSFDAVVSESAAIGSHIVNGGSIEWVTDAGIATAVADPVRTEVRLPPLTLSKTVIGPAPARAGDTLTYVIQAVNRSSRLALRGLTVTDTLPSLLRPILPDRGHLQGQMARWELAVLEPGETATFQVGVIVRDSVEDGDEVINRVHAEDRYGRRWTATSERRFLLSADTARVDIEIEPGALQAGLGESVPFTILATNSGAVGLLEMGITVRLPAGTRQGQDSVIVYTDAPQSASPAASLPSTVSLTPGGTRNSRWRRIQPDSIRTTEGEIRIYFPASLNPGQSFAFTYDMIVLDPRATTLETVAIVNARRGRALAIGEVLSLAVTKVDLQVRSVRPLETRAAFGKVFWDRNENGVQDPDEPGIAGVEVWSEDGEVARTGEFGKYSFVNVRPGRHAFRIDESTLPPWAMVVGEPIQWVRADGWTTPRVSFRIASRLAEVLQDAPVPEDAGADSMVIVLGPRPGRNAFVWQVPEGWEVEYTTAVGGGSSAQSLPSSSSFASSPRTRGPMFHAQSLPIATGEDGDDGRVEERHARESGPRGGNLGPRLRGDDESGGGDDESGGGDDVWSRGGDDAGGGGRWLEWPASAGAQRVVLRRAGAAAPAEPARVAPARTEEERANDRRRVVLAGPAPEIFSPADGTVIPTDRLWVGVRGEPMRQVELYDGDRLIEAAQLRPDGVHDFINLELVGEGTHTLRLKMTNSWGQERWDSIHVHVGGRARRFHTPDPVRVEAGRTSDPVRVRLLDRWGVPVVRPTDVTVEADGATIAAKDANASSIGIQLRQDSAGYITFPVTAGHQTGEFRIRVRTDSASATVPLIVTPALAPLQVTAVGQLSIGNSRPDDFAAVTARGRVTDRTALTVSIDSRRLDAGAEMFGRAVDPLDEGQYPILGDASTRRSPGAAQGPIAARLERDLDYLAYGDLEHSDFAEGLTLGRYSRALTSTAGRFDAGPITIRAFGAMTSQAVREERRRGDGTSGPYDVAGGVLPGTERVLLQLRALENDARILSERTLTRFVDYQIDYSTGRILLKRPVASADGHGNPLYVVVRYESVGAGDSNPVWGARMTGTIGDTTRLALPIGIHLIRQENPLDAFQMVGVEYGIFRSAALDVRGELVRAANGDSVDVANHIHGTARLLDGALTANARWMHVGDAFANPSDPGLRPATDELQAGAKLRIGETDVGWLYEWQSFGIVDAERERTQLSVEHRLREGLTATVGGGLENARRDTLAEDARFAEGRLTWRATDRLRVWQEARAQTSSTHMLLDGNYYGGGAAFELFDGVELEAKHLFVRHDSAGSFTLSSVGLRSEFATGTRAWGSYEMPGGIDGARGAALVGLSQRISIARDWTLRAQYERRKGARLAPLASRVLADPTNELRNHYWAASVGAEFLPSQRPYRLSSHVELNEGDLEAGLRGTLSGEFLFNEDLALLARQEYMSRHRQTQAGGTETANLIWTVWGLAFRPTEHDALNGLVKVEWKREQSTRLASLLDGDTDRERVILTGEMIWAPTASLDAGVRYGRRFARNALVAGTIGIPMQSVSDADFAAARFRTPLLAPVSLAAEVQMLRAVGTGDLTWSAAPALVYDVSSVLEIEGGYRFGALVDPDFQRHQGEGWFVSFGARMTEHTVRDVAGFWRGRAGR